MTTKTPAQEAGFEIGKTYRMVEHNSESYPAGTLVTFLEDDTSTCPKFSVPEALDDDGWNYIFLTDIDPEALPSYGDVTFEDSTVSVPVEITIITVKRKLTETERAAIAAIVNQ